MVKRWWIIALVFTLALSLTSCGRYKAGLQSGVGAVRCDGTPSLGTVYAYMFQKNNTWQISIITEASTAAAGQNDLVAVAIVKKGTNTYTVKVQSVPLVVGSAGEIQIPLTTAELNTYNYLAVVQRQQGLDPNTQLFQHTTKRALCDFPYPQN